MLSVPPFINFVLYILLKSWSTGYNRNIGAGRNQKYLILTSCSTNEERPWGFLEVREPEGTGAMTVWLVQALSIHYATSCCHSGCRNITGGDKFSGKIILWKYAHQFLRYPTKKILPHRQDRLSRPRAHRNLHSYHSSSELVLPHERLWQKAVS